LLGWRTIRRGGNGVGSLGENGQDFFSFFGNLISYFLILELGGFFPFLFSGDENIQTQFQNKKEEAETEAEAEAEEEEKEEGGRKGRSKDEGKANQRGGKGRSKSHTDHKRRSEKAIIIAFARNKTGRKR